MVQFQSKQRKTISKQFSGNWRRMKKRVAFITCVKAENWEDTFFTEEKEKKESTQH
jgi:hypothetical protein